MEDATLSARAGGKEEAKDMSTKHQVWYCKVGIKGDVQLPGGADFPMRQAIKEAFFQVTGVEADFCFSGWNAPLTDIEESIVETKQ